MDAEMSLRRELSSMALGLGADFFGVADLTQATPAIVEQGGEWVAKFPRAISVGVALMDAIIDEIPQRERRGVRLTWRAHAYDLVNARLDQITARLASLLQAAGHSALPVPASSIVDEERLMGIFSHKMAAHLAGLGWIGRSCLLVTPEAGPRVRWASVLTSAALPAGKPLEPGCNDCHACVDACPVHAFTGRLFDPLEPRNARYDAARCRAYLNQLDVVSPPALCGMCMYACPHGRKKVKGPAAPILRLV